MRYNSCMENVVYDMETSDVDDICALCILCYHPAFNLRAVTITPGSIFQVWVVKEFLTLCGRGDVPVGSREVDLLKECVSGPIIKYFGEIKALAPDGVGCDILESVFQKYPDTTLITGAPLCNPRKFIEKTALTINRWVGQGGFAGDNVVPPEHRLAKFAGMRTCATFNFNGDTKGAQLLLSTPKINKRVLVSKNVCHGVIYDRLFHERLKLSGNSTDGFKTMMNFMEHYLSSHSLKAFHDPLAVCVAARENICEFRRVELFREKGLWGSKLSDASNTSISVMVDMNLFFDTLTGA